LAYGDGCISAGYGAGGTPLGYGDGYCCPFRFRLTKSQIPPIVDFCLPSSTFLVPATVLSTHTPNKKSRKKAETSTFILQSSWVRVSIGFDDFKYHFPCMNIVGVCIAKRKSPHLSFGGAFDTYDVHLLFSVVFRKPLLIDGFSSSSVDVVRGISKG
jgi:hypothetical protein